MSQDNSPRLFELEKEISYLVQGSLSVSSYFTRFKTLWDEFVNNQPFTICTYACVCGSKSSQLDAQHKEHVFRFLMGLNNSYGTLIGQILLIEPFPTLSKVCSLVLQEEKMRNISNTVNVVQQVDAVAMYVNNNRPFQGAQGQNKCGGKGNKDRPICTYCGFTGHIADKCYKLHRYPPGYKLKGGNRPMVNQVSGPFGFDVNNIGFPNVQSNVLPTQGVQSEGMIQNLVNTPFGAQTGF